MDYMKIPHELKIGGHQYRIFFPYVFTERFDLCGDHNASAKIIRIADSEFYESRSTSAITVTLIHEILHAIDSVSGHNMFDGDEGEKHIEALSEGIYQVLADNPELRM